MPNVSFAKKRATTIRYIHDPLILAFKISETFLHHTVRNKYVKICT